MKVSRTHYIVLPTSIPPLNSHPKFSSLVPCLGTPGLVSFLNLLQWTFLYEAFCGHTCLEASTITSAQDLRAENRKRACEGRTLSPF